MEVIQTDEARRELLEMLRTRQKKWLGKVLHHDFLPENTIAICQGRRVNVKC